jgi:hypothetical protein
MDNTRAETAEAPGGPEIERDRPPRGDADGTPPIEGGETAGGRGGCAYRYTCPICGSNRLGCVSDESPVDRAVTALQSHIRVIDGGGHGPKHELPARWTRDALEAQVEVGKS